ncbi:MAG TPA: hypothetical protein RMH99_03060 [Sandaracinaceae bacterium LLY-WYZ-13_1]|nr:hypothetical protein [Sandaracinaceae bacterium LLY-WYZ-13_1]
MDTETDRRRGNGCLYLAGGVGVLLVLGGGALELVGEVDLGGDDAPEVEVAPERGFDPSTAVGEAPPAASVPEPAPPEPPPPAAPPTPPVDQRLCWHAFVQSGPAAPAGTACVLALDVALDGTPVDVRLDCDGRAVYEAPASGHLEAVREGAERAAYRAWLDSALTGASLGARTGRHELTLRTVSGVTTLFVRDLSVPTRGPVRPPRDASRVAHRLRRRAVPVQMRGDVPPEVLSAGDDTPCALFGSTVIHESYDCRLTLRCGARILYGAGTTGYNDCTVADGRIVAVSDEGTTIENQDPRFVLDAEAGTLEVADDDGQVAWSVRFELDEDPRCRLDGAWAGVARSADGTLQTWTMRDGPGPRRTVEWVVEGRPPVLETVRAEVDCATGRATWHTIEEGGPILPADYELTFGPGWDTLAGPWVGEGAERGALHGARRP